VCESRERASGGFLKPHHLLLNAECIGLLCTNCCVKRCAEYFQLSGQTSYYRVIFETLNKFQAEERCRQFHPRSHLVAIETESEFLALKSYVNAIPGRTFVCFAQSIFTNTVMERIWASKRIFIFWLN